MKNRSKGCRRATINVCIVGPSKVGKSTLIRRLSRLPLPPSTVVAKTGAAQERGDADEDDELLQRVLQNSLLHTTGPVSVQPPTFEIPPGGIVHGCTDVNMSDLKLKLLPVTVTPSLPLTSMSPSSRSPLSSSNRSGQAEAATDGTSIASRATRSNYTKGGIVVSERLSIVVTEVSSDALGEAWLGVHGPSADVAVVMLSCPLHNASRAGKEKVAADLVEIRNAEALLPLTLKRMYVVNMKDLLSEEVQACIGDNCAVGGVGAFTAASLSPAALCTPQGEWISGIMAFTKQPLYFISADTGDGVQEAVAVIIETALQPDQPKSGV